MFVFKKKYRTYHSTLDLVRIISNVVLTIKFKVKKQVSLTFFDIQSCRTKRACIRRRTGRSAWCSAALRTSTNCTTRITRAASSSSGSCRNSSVSWLEVLIDKNWCETKTVKIIEYIIIFYKSVFDVEFS